jgi:enoyl-[acyl-carrier-protein] reductase (NADH)
VEQGVSHSDPQPAFTARSQSQPGKTDLIEPKPDHGERDYKGSGRLQDKKAVITGGDGGTGRAVAIAFAREGADILISYLPEEESDAQQVRSEVEAAGRTAILVPGDISSADHCRSIIARAVEEFGEVDILVNNAAYQKTFNSIFTRCSTSRRPPCRT